jgi:hypothetical protein
MALFERRKEPRLSHQGHALVTNGFQAYQVEMVDLSKSGACIRRPRNWNLHIGEEVQVYPLGDIGPVMRFSAQVRWFQDDEIGLEYR